MRYIQVSSSYAPAWGFGGPVRMFLDYAKWMTGVASDVTVFAGDLDVDLEPIDRDDARVIDVQVERFDVLLPQLVRRSMWLLSPKLLAALTARIRGTTGLVLIHVWELRGMAPLYALAAAELFPRNVRIVYSAFGQLHAKSSRIREVYDRLFLARFLERLSLVFVENDHEHETFIDLVRSSGAKAVVNPTLLPLHVSKSKVLPAWHDGDRKVSSMKNEIRQKLGLPQDADIFIFLGRICREKGLRRTVDAFAAYVQQSTRPCLLLIVGAEYGYQAQLMKHVASLPCAAQISVRNNVHDERFEYYFAADVFLGLPIIFEETMLASVEALVCGTPIIVSREADLPWVHQLDAGRVIDFTLETCVASMNHVVRNQARMASAAHRVAREHFSDDTIKTEFRSAMQILDGESPMAADRGGVNERR